MNMHEVHCRSYLQVQLLLLDPRRSHHLFTHAAHDMFGATVSDPLLQKDPLRIEV